MRSQSTIEHSIWFKTMRNMTLNEKLLAIYLRSSPSSTYLGLYYLPLPIMIHETGIPEKEITNTLNRLSQLGFAYYHPQTQQIYVPSMAATEIGGQLKEGDKRIKALQRLFEDLEYSPLCDLFYRDYAVSLRLRKRPDTKDPEESHDEINKTDQPNPPEKQPTKEIKTTEQYLERYTPEQQQKVQNTLDLLTSTRKSGKMSDSIVLNLLRTWDSIDIHRVMRAMDIYADRGCHLHNKRENYLKAIMMNLSEDEVRLETTRKEPVKLSEITRHNLIVMKNVCESMNRERSNAGVD